MGEQDDWGIKGKCLKSKEMLNNEPIKGLNWGYHIFVHHHTVWPMNVAWVGMTSCQKYTLLQKYMREKKDRWLNLTCSFHVCIYICVCLVVCVCLWLCLCMDVLEFMLICVSRDISMPRLCRKVHLFACLDVILGVFGYMSEHLHVFVCGFCPLHFIARTFCFAFSWLPDSDGLLNV